MKFYIGIDLGGTNIRAAKVLEDGSLIEINSCPTEALKGREHVLESIINLIKSLKDYDKALGIGIGAPGPIVDDTMMMSTNLVGFKNFPLGKYLREEFNLPCFVENDANCAGLAESYAGAGKGSKIVYYLTHSTGIGGALVIDGKLIAGKNGYAGEIGNMIIDRNGTTHNALNKGALENIASGLALNRKLKAKYNLDWTAKDLFDNYQNNDSIAKTVVEEMVDDLAVAMANIAHVIDPDVFVIGGGVSKAKDYYFDSLENKLRSYVHEGMRSISIKPASIKEPGVIGAAMLVRSKLS